MLSSQEGAYIFIANKGILFPYHVSCLLFVNGQCQAGVIMSANHKKILQRETSSHEIRSLIPWLHLINGNFLTHVVSPSKKYKHIHAKNFPSLIQSNTNWDSNFKRPTIFFILMSNSLRVERPHLMKLSMTTMKSHRRRCSKSSSENKQQFQNPRILCQNLLWWISQSAREDGT